MMSLGHKDIERPSKEMMTGLCKMCSKPTLLQSVCQDCGLISFNEIYAEAQE